LSFPNAFFKSFPPARYPVPRCVFAGASLLFGF